MFVGAIVRRKLQLLVAAGLVAVTGAAVAGMKASAPVYVGTTFASGSLGSTRNSTNTTEYMEVIVSNGTWAWVVARSPTAFGSCTTTDPNMIRLAESVTQDAYVYFSWDASGACSHLEVRHGSYFEPAQP